MDAGERKCTILWPNVFSSDRAYLDCNNDIPNRIKGVMHVVLLRINIVTNTDGRTKGENS